MTVEEVKGVRSWASLLEPLMVKLKGVTGPNAPHMFRMVCRKDLIHEGANDLVVDRGAWSFDVPESPYDVVLLVKQYMHSEVLSQEPLLLLPQIELLRLQPPMTSTLRNELPAAAKKNQYLKTARVVRRHLWCLFRAAGYLERWVNQNVTLSQVPLAVDELWPQHFVLRGRSLISQSGIESECLTAASIDAGMITVNQVSLTKKGKKRMLTTIPASEEDKPDVMHGGPKKKKFWKRQSLSLSMKSPGCPKCRYQAARGFTGKSRWYDSRIAFSKTSFIVFMHMVSEANNMVRQEKQARKKAEKEEEGAGSDRERNLIHQQRVWEEVKQNAFCQWLHCEEVLEKTVLEFEHEKSGVPQMSISRMHADQSRSSQE